MTTNLTSGCKAVVTVGPLVGETVHVVSVDGMLATIKVADREYTLVNSVLRAVENSNEGAA